jgi:uncharacterized membrane protein (UPF0136 family)
MSNYHRFNRTTPPLRPSVFLTCKLTQQLSGVSLVSGAYAYARFGSIPSLLGSFGIGGLMAMSSMRMKDNMNYGVEGAAGPFLFYLLRVCEEN